MKILLEIWHPDIDNMWKLAVFLSKVMNLILVGKYEKYVSYEYANHEFFTYQPPCMIVTVITLPKVTIKIKATPRMTPPVSKS